MMGERISEIEGGDREESEPSSVPSPPTASDPSPSSLTSTSKPPVTLSTSTARSAFRSSVALLLPLSGGNDAPLPGVRLITLSDFSDGLKGGEVDDERQSASQSDSSNMFALNSSISTIKISKPCKLSPSSGKGLLSGLTELVPPEFFQTCGTGDSAND